LIYAIRKIINLHYFLRLCLRFIFSCLQAKNITYGVSIGGLPFGGAPTYTRLA
jgi:hypothetical protein